MNKVLLEAASCQYSMCNQYTVSSYLKMYNV
nr:MAG TPA: hypothetical protein [Caudoviricetes sp.]